MHMIMAHARAPALATRAMLRKLPCELLMCQWSALCFAQDNSCVLEAAGFRRDDAKGSREELCTYHVHYARSRSRTLRDPKRL